MGKRKNRQKKTNSELKQYKDSLEKYSGGIDSTDPRDSVLLVGSDAVGNDRPISSEKEDPVKRVPLKHVVLDWLIKHVVETVVTVVLIPLVIWIVSSTIEVQREQAVMAFRLGVLEESISDLSDELPNIGLLEFKIDMLRDDLSGISLQDFDRRIEALENALMDID